MDRSETLFDIVEDCQQVFTLDIGDVKLTKLFDLFRRQSLIYHQVLHVIWPEHQHMPLVFVIKVAGLSSQLKLREVRELLKLADQVFVQ